MTDYAIQDDPSLARLTLAGELAAFDELARRYQSPLLRFVRRRLPGEAEDVVQETLIKAYERLRQYRAGRSFRAWIFGIAYHESIDQLRRRQSRPAEHFNDAAGGEDPADHAAATDRKAWLWSQARVALSDDQFTAVWLFYVEQLSTREIAEVQNRSWVSVKVSLHRARAALAKQLATPDLIELATPVTAGDL